MLNLLQKQKFLIGVSSGFLHLLTGLFEKKKHSQKLPYSNKQFTHLRKSELAGFIIGTWTVAPSRSDPDHLPMPAVVALGAVRPPRPVMQPRSGARQMYLFHIPVVVGEQQPQI